MRASTKAWTSAPFSSVGIGSVNSVPWPPGAVIRVPAENRSARLPLRPAAMSLVTACITDTPVNMSTWVVTPNIRGRSRCWKACTWASIRPGNSVRPAPGTTRAPAGTSPA